MFEKPVYQISDAEKQMVEATIGEAEKNSSVEIYAVLAERSDDYRFIAFSYLALWTFIISALFSVFLYWYQQYSDGGWSSDMVPTVYFLWAQILAFLSGLAVLRYIPGLAGMVIPHRIAHERAHSNAVKQFLAHGTHHTKDRTGVLVFISLQERYGEILVDQLIEERIGRQYFLDEVEVMLKTCDTRNIAEALDQTINRLGKKLAEDFPGSLDDRNELPDKLIVM